MAIFEPDSVLFPQAVMDRKPAGDHGTRNGAGAGDRGKWGCSEQTYVHAIQLTRPALTDTEGREFATDTGRHSNASPGAMARLRATMNLPEALCGGDNQGQQGD